MRKSILKKATAVAMSLTMVVGMTGVVSAAHASNGADVATNAKVSSFSILTEEDGGVWKKALENIRTDKYPNGQVAGKDFVTEEAFAEIRTDNKNQCQRGKNKKSLFQMIFLLLRFSSC